VATTVAFVSEKGGVGKTTTCYHVAASLALDHKMSVLVVDADYQRGGISGRFFPDLIDGFNQGQVPGTTLFHKFQQLYSASDQTSEVTTRRWQWGGCEIDVIPSDPRLSGISSDKLPGTMNVRENNKLILQHMQAVKFVLDGLCDNYDYILIDSHPEVSDVLRSVIYASDYCVSPVKLDRQSSIGVATVIGEINNVNADVEMLSALLGDAGYAETHFAGSIGMMAREWGGDLKQTERVEYNRLKRTGGVFESYVTEGDGLRQAAAARTPVFGIGGANADKQAKQLRDVTNEFLQKCP
jgi:chromosome partitioning protein